MITVDSRVGSGELHRLFPSGTAKVGQLEYGDFAWMGNGPDGPVMLGAERKTIGDLLQSLNTDRFVGHQLPGLTNNYHRVYLVVEGHVRPSPRDNTLEWRVNGQWEKETHGLRPIMYRDFIGRLHTFQEMANLRVVHTDSPQSTVVHVLALYHWWDKKWCDHQSMCAIYEPRPPMLSKPSLMRRFANVIPGIGWERSEAVAAHFGTVDAMVNAEPKEWERIDGIGKGIAKKAWLMLHEKV